MPQTIWRPASYKHRIANSDTAPIGFFSESIAKYTPFSLAETSIVAAVTLANTELRGCFSDDKYWVIVTVEGIASTTAVSKMFLNGGHHAGWVDGFLEK